MYLRAATIALFLLSAFHVAAEETELDKCLAAIDAEDPLAHAVALLRLANDDEAYAECYAAHQQAEEARKTRIDAIYAASRERAQARQDLNNSLIDDDVLEACTDLFISNKIAAMTNSVCVNAFRRLGHPEISQRLEDE